MRQMDLALLQSTSAKSKFRRRRHSQTKQLRRRTRHHSCSRIRTKRRRRRRRSTRFKSRAVMRSQAALMRRRQTSPKKPPRATSRQTAQAQPAKTILIAAARRYQATCRRTTSLSSGKTRMNWRTPRHPRNATGSHLVNTLGLRSTRSPRTRSRRSSSAWRLSLRSRTTVTRWTARSLRMPSARAQQI